MNNEKLTSKIKNISRFSVVGLIVYLGLAVYALFPDAKSGFIDGWNDYEENGLDDVSDFAAVLGFPVSVVMIVALIIAVVAGLQLLFGMSKGASPFTEKISRAIKNMGVSLIVLEVSKTLFMYMYEETIEIGMLWLAGLVLYAFSLVFRYGTILQQESDETL